ncbi:MAG: PAS domain S-box protein [Prolixibacteraceae bacterium]|nr:PAS domain S-box protein [Prolixibacteraceae bacterium]
MLYDYFWSRKDNYKNIYFKFSTGFVLGGIGIVLILTPWHYIPGIIFDTRSVVLSITGLFFGLIPTITAMVITALYRLIMGGAGAYMGMAVILCSGSIGLLWRYFRPGWRKSKIRELALLGVLVHLMMLFCTFLLPAELIWNTLKIISLPVIIIYPLATMLLGVLMLHQEENSDNRKALKNSEEKFRAIIEQASDAMYLSDMDGNIIDTNRQACTNLGYSRDEILKKNVWQLDALRNSGETVKIEFQKMASGESFIFESLHRRKDGSTFPVEVNASIISINGEPFVLGFVRDITERKLNEEKIIRIAKHYQALIEKAPDGIVLIDAEGNFKFISPSARKLFGYSEFEVVVGNPATYVHPDDLQMVLTSLQDLLHDPSTTLSLQYRFRSKDGYYRWVESIFSNLLADPSVESIVINFRDITDRKIAEEEIKKLNEELERKVTERTNELEKSRRELLDNEAALMNLVEDLNQKSEELQRSTAQLELSNKELEAFSYSVSHDLRAPLRAISGFVGILLEDYEQSLDAEGKRICRIIQTNAVKMGQLIDDLLSFSRLIRSELHQTPIDMGNLVRNIISDFEVTQDLSGITIIIHDLPKSFGDQNLLKQVWINLISNAIKYSSKVEKPEIIIGSDILEKEKVYYIKDNGVGFNMDYVHKLFGVFQRLHSINEFDGTGVGLAIVQRIVNRHNGKVWAKGEVGKGASFYFSIPEI